MGLGFIHNVVCRYESDALVQHASDDCGLVVMRFGVAKLRGTLMRSDQARMPAMLRHLSQQLLGLGVYVHQSFCY